MKNVIIAILMIIPLFIVLSVNFSSQLIVANANVEVSAIKIVHNGATVEKTLSFYLSQTSSIQLSVNVYPSIASNSMVSWRCSDNDIATVDENGKVTFYRLGTITITAESMGNKSAQHSITIVITDSEIQSIALENTTLNCYERARLSLEIVPQLALGDDSVNWQIISGENIVALDRNGVIYAEKEGTAVIQASVMTGSSKDKQVTATATITVLPAKALFKTGALYIMNNTLDLSSYLLDSEASLDVLSGDAILGNSIITFTNEGEAVVRATKGEKESTLTVTYTAGKLFVADENYEYLLNDGEIVIWKGSRNLFIEPKVLNVDYQGEAVNFSVETVDTAASGIVAIDKSNGGYVLFGNEVGNTTLEFVASDYLGEVISTQIKIKVASPLLDFRLELSDDAKENSIAGEYVFGNLFYTAKGLSSEYQLKTVNLFPEDAESAFEYSSSDDALAVVDSNGLITFSDNFGQHDYYEVTITAKAKYVAASSELEKSYTFKIVKGVNIGYTIDDNTYNNEDSDSTPDFGVFDEFAALGDSAEFVGAIVLHANVFARETADTLHLSHGIYGNGFIYSAEFMTNYRKDFSIYSFLVDGQSVSNCDELIFSNLRMSSAMPRTAIADYKADGGFLFNIVGNDDETEGKSVIFEYCVLQNAFTLCTIAGFDVTFNGCILRNTAGPCLTQIHYYNQTPDITITNCIFSNTIAPCFTSFCDTPSFTDKEPIPEGESMEFGTVTLKGVNYIYNWTSLDTIDLNVIPDSIFGNMKQLQTLFGDFINRVARTELRAIDGITTVVDGKQYVNLGFFLVGMHQNIGGFINDETKTDKDGMRLFMDTSKYNVVTIDPSDLSLSYVSGILSSLGYANPCYVLLPNDTGMTSPNETYNDDAATYSRLRGEQ